MKRFLPQAAVFIAVIFLFCADLLRYPENYLQDWLYQRPGLTSLDIYIIGIDEKTLMDLGPVETWSRSATADLIDILSADPESAPAVIGVDIGFYGEKGADDEKLALAAKNAGNVVLASYVTFGGEVVETDQGFYTRRAVKTLEQPYSALAEHSVSGFTNVLPEDDGIVRRSLSTLNGPENQPLESFTRQICRLWQGEVPDPDLDQNGQWYVPFTGVSGDYFGASFSDVLSGDADPAQFAGSIVLIGPYSAGMMDAYYTPMSRSDQMYGVEVHANFLQALLDQNFKQESPFWIRLLGVSVVLLLCLVVFRKLDLRVSGVLGAVFSVAYGFLAAALYGQGQILVLVYPIVAIWAMFLLYVFRNYLSEIHERRRILDIFGRYVSPQVAGSIVRQGESSLNLEGQKRDIAVLFVDIRGFTTLSESMEPEQVVQILDRYFDLTTRAIFDAGGTVDKFIGDATMALFNAPLELEDYELRAVRAGLAIRDGSLKLAQEIHQSFGIQLSLGVGIHSGPAVVGNIGTPFRMDYTAIGDTVNTASRLEGQAQAGEVLISEELFHRLEGRISAECLGGRTLKGKSGEFTVYRVNAEQKVIS